MVYMTCMVVNVYADWYNIWLSYSGLFVVAKAHLI